MLVNTCVFQFFTVLYPYFHTAAIPVYKLFSPVNTTVASSLHSICRIFQRISHLCCSFRFFSLGFSCFISVHLLIVRSDTGFPISLLQTLASLRVDSLRECLPCFAKRLSFRSSVSFHCLFYGLYF